MTIFLNLIPNCSIILIFYLEKYKIPFFLIGLCIALILGGKDTNYWGIVDENGKQILNKIESRAVETYHVELTEKQFKEIEGLINKEPEQYSLIQKSLISKETVSEILLRAELELTNTNEIHLNFKQHQEIISLIQRNPENYSQRQKDLVKEKSGKQILLDVGLGVKKPGMIKLSPNQYNEIKTLLLDAPYKYSKIQKELIPEIKKELEQIGNQYDSRTKVPIVLNLNGEDVLIAIGNGAYIPSQIKLTAKQYHEIKKLLLSTPNNYNKVQKALIPELKSELEKIE